VSPCNRKFVRRVASEQRKSLIEHKVACAAFPGQIGKASRCRRLDAGVSMPNEHVDGIGPAWHNGQGTPRCRYRSRLSVFAVKIVVVISTEIGRNATAGNTNPLFSPRGETKCVRGRQYEARAGRRAQAYSRGTLNTATKRNEVMAGLWRASAVRW